MGQASSVEEKRQRGFFKKLGFRNSGSRKGKVDLEDQEVEYDQTLNADAVIPGCSKQECGAHTPVRSVSSLSLLGDPRSPVGTRTPIVMVNKAPGVMEVAPEAAPHGLTELCDNLKTYKSYVQLKQQLQGDMELLKSRIQKQVIQVRTSFLDEDDLDIFNMQVKQEVQTSNSPPDDVMQKVQIEANKLVQLLEESSSEEYILSPFDDMVEHGLEKDCEDLTAGTNNYHNSVNAENKENSLMTAPARTTAAGQSEEAKMSCDKNKTPKRLKVRGPLTGLETNTSSPAIASRKAVKVPVARPRSQVPSAKVSVFKDLTPTKVPRNKMTSTVNPLKPEVEVAQVTTSRRQPTPLPRVALSSKPR